ncbi:MAG: PDZ domain-containing protein, partial [Actinomycetota bacterium]|nr:PDZ domain-containing protein [Actinomycetota bacterium]
MNPVKIQEVRRRSLAEKYGIKAGDKLVSINGKKLRDIIDYELCAADEDICLDVIQNGSQRRINIKNPCLESLGIIFSTSLFDGVKRCANKCIFCFIDQLPPGMRKSVYIKDDDYRLSFLYGNFITLTNMKEQDIERIIKHRLSPIYVSLHTTNPELRAKMLGQKRKDRTYEYLKILLDAGIEIHIQMVLCPGINDGA